MCLGNRVYVSCYNIFWVWEYDNTALWWHLFPQTSHKKTFLYLEQLILKHRMHSSALRVKETSDGLDFFFAQRQEARKLVDFLQTVVPCR